MADEWTGEIDRPIRVWTNPRITDDIYLHFSEVLKQVKFYAPKFKGVILDVGAGKAPYKEFFANASKYIRLDNRRYKGTDIEADATKKIPLNDNSVDNAVCFQVLEHVKEPAKLIDEIYRVLKPNGLCLLTTHMAAPLHGMPYDYYRFTKFILADLFRKFRKIEIKPNGGALLSIFQLIAWGLSEKLPKFLSFPFIILLNIFGKLGDKILYSPLFTLNYSVFAVK